MTKPITAPTTLPDWFRRLPANACVTPEELAEMLNVSKATIHNRIADKTLPEPERNMVQMAGNKRHQKQPLLRWRAAVIREFFAELQKNDAA
jgi:predicted DNA-binding transcriptional regulator AlpA